MSLEAPFAAATDQQNICSSRTHASNGAGVSPARLFLPPLALASVVIALFFAPPTPFTIDGGIYYDMARSFAEDGALHLTGGLVIDGEAIAAKGLTGAYNGLIYAQYPAGYAVIASPFYLAFGVRGLILLNALSALAAVIFTYVIARRLYKDRAIAVWSCFVLCGATYLANYTFAIWPHALSLAFYAGALACAVIGVDKESRGKQFAWQALAGLIIGAGVTVRLDLILAAPVIFIWLKLFAAPGRRLAPAALLAGLTPGLCAAAGLNFMKFGVASPFFYGGESGGHHADLYFPLAVAGGALLLLTTFFNVRKIGALTLARFRRPSLAIGGIAAAAIVFATWPALAKTLHGLWVLMIDLQALAPQYFQNGVERNEFGQLLFWGFPKRALVQSLPFMALLIIPVAEFFRGRRVNAHALCLVAIAAPITFYAMTQWHGGASYNLRYFVPTLPFISILSALALHRLTDGVMPRLRSLLVAGVAAFVVLLVADEIGRAAARLAAPAALYPQSAIFAALLTTCAVYLFIEPLQEKARKAALFLGLFALAYGAAINFRDEIAHEKARDYQLAQSEAIARALPTDAIILTNRQILGIAAERAGAVVMNVYPGNADLAVRAAETLSAVGRCVFIQSDDVRQTFTDAARPGAVSDAPFQIGGAQFAGDPLMDFYILTAQTPRCAVTPQR